MVRVNAPLESRQTTTGASIVTDLRDRRPSTTGSEGAGGRRRLQNLSLASAIFFSAALAVIAVGSATDPVRSWWLGALCVGLAGCSWLLWATCRGEWLRRDRYLPLAHGYVVLGSLAMSLTEIVLYDPTLPAIRGIPGLCVWIALFPLIFTAGWRMTLLTAGLSAGTLPVAWLLLAPGPVRPEGLVAWLLAPSACAGIAIAVGRLADRLQRRLDDARRQLRELGGYQLIKPIGEGAMGSVWEAKHRFLARSAAIKFGAMGGADENPEEALDRFEREARLIATLRSPFTVELYDYGITDDDRCYFVMERLEGLDLQQLMDEHGPQPQERVRHFLIQACASLGEAHRLGVVHRDIKPANCFCCRLGVTLDVLKVLDFGLAADFAGNPGDEQAIHGTPLYLAPERRGGDGLVTPSADLYSLGALAWFLLVGRPPLIADNLPDVLELHAQVMPERPSIALGSDIHPGLEALIMGCLAKHPLQRPAGADSLRRDLLALDMEPWTDDSALAWWSTVGPGSGGLNQVRPEAETRLIT